MDVDLNMDVCVDACVCGRVYKIEMNPVFEMLTCVCGFLIPVYVYVCVYM